MTVRKPNSITQEIGDAVDLKLSKDDLNIALVRLHRHLVTAIDTGTSYLFAHNLAEAIGVTRREFKCQARSFGTMIRRAGWWAAGMVEYQKAKSTVYVPASYTDTEARRLLAHIPGIAFVAGGSVNDVTPQRVLAPPCVSPDYDVLPLHLVAVAEKTDRDMRDAITNDSEAGVAEPVPVKRKRGRPPGSKNKVPRAMKNQHRVGIDEDDVDVARFRATASKESSDEDLHTLAASGRTGKAMEAVADVVITRPNNQRIVEAMKPNIEVKVVQPPKSQVPGYSGIVHVVHCLRDIIDCFTMTRIRALFQHQVNDAIWEQLQVEIIDELSEKGWEATPVQLPDGTYSLCMVWDASNNAEVGNG
jgi:hypothetical protein